MKILAKLSQIQIEFTSDEIEALKHIFAHYRGDYERLAEEIYELIK